MDKEVRVNKRIRASEVRLIDPDGVQLGVFPIGEALTAATDRGLDLVEVSPKSNPPVCRIMDYGKYKYQQKKKLQEAKKKQSVIHIKEVKLRPKIEEHDLQFKLRHIERFLSEGDKVKVTVMFRGREITRKELGQALLERLVEETKELGTIDQSPKQEGRNLVMFLSPIHRK
ncbi:MAG: translation initiation factor IF-3 [Deltaproteobacteria bacterium]|nr:MAG: translation initiation factor IF-3 [Deltaproteobacteria bacterium]